MLFGDSEINSRIILMVKINHNSNSLFPVIIQAGLDPFHAGVRLNFGTSETSEIIMADLLNAAELGVLRPEEFGKNAVKFGWELWEKESEVASG